MFEMFTGRVPFSADTPFATIHDHIYTPLPLPSTINPAIDSAVERLLLKALAKNPNDRFATADELLTALEMTLNPPAADSTTAKPIRSAQAAASQKGRVPWWIWAGGVALFLLVFVGIVGGTRLWQRAQQARQTETAQAASSIPLAATGEPQPLPLPTSEPTAAATSEPTEPVVSNPQAGDLAQQAAAAASQQQMDRAIELYRQAIAADPHYLPAYFGLSNTLRQQGDRPGSLSVLEEAAAQNPQEVDAWLRLGEAQLAEDQAEAALKAFEQAVSLAPDSAGALARQALALMALDQVDAAKPVLDTALGLDPLNPETHLAQAMYLFKTGDRRGARRELQLLIQSGRAPVFVIERARQMLAGLNN
ncbi:MAG: tetratricopeptide repeat protein [Anaerolineales bacterium]|nr:tetratricopeptide repeat protein [Anaerolineales bacterium]